MTWLKKWTTRRLMALVLGIGFSLGLGLPALDVMRDDSQHAHVWVESRDVEDSNGDLVIYYHGGMRQDVHSPFWPRYWRHLQGLPWKKQSFCRPTAQELLTFCEFDPPVIRAAKVERYRSIPMHKPIPRLTQR